ncbi:MAG: ecotin family protein [Lentisphaeria bacterium]|nr:ecotin family protein [Lentisphaeria bacterium]
MSRVLTGISLIVVFGASVLVAAEHKELKNYPEAKEGMERHVIILPHKERGEEGAFKVELLPGKTMLTDGVNQARLGCSLERQTLKGWGYTYFDLTGSMMAASTLIGVPPGTEKVERFVGGQPLLTNYNSRLPIVIYAPAGCEIRYRIWTAPQAWESSEKK